VALAKLRWRVEHDYRELKQCLGLDHYEGRSYRGLHHHLTCVTVAHAFLTCCRLSRDGPPQTAAAKISLCQAQRDLQTAPACWHNYWSGSRDRVDSSSILI
jgi:SRSO17 transposase